MSERLELLKGRRADREEQGLLWNEKRKKDEEDVRCVLICC